jgi:ubiquitin C-terminal hydrolase
MEKFKGTRIKIQRETITEALKSNDDLGKETDLPYIPLGLPNLNNPNESVTVKKMLHDWMYDNLKEVTRCVITDKGKVNKSVPGLDVNHIVNSPSILALSINRFQNRIENGKIVIRRNSTGVDIQRKISPFHNKHTVNKHEWIFHAAVCHRGDTINSGHYYSILTRGEEYYVFDDLNTPCLTLVGMENPEVTNIIKRECILLIYRLIV